MILPIDPSPTLPAFWTIAEDAIAWFFVGVMIRAIVVAVQEPSP